MKFGAFCPLLVALIKLFKALCLLSLRMERTFDGARHMLLRGRDICMDPCGHGSENRGAQRTALIGGHNLQRPVQHVAAGLHNHRVFTGDPTQRHHVVHVNALVDEALHDGARAERGGGNQAAKQRGRVGREVEIGNHPFQTLVGKRRTTPVEPVQHHRQVVERRIFCPGVGELRQKLFFARRNLRFQFRMRGSQLIQRPAEHAAKPGVDIAEGGLARFEADKIGYHAAVNLTADAFHRAVADAGFICRQNVTGGGADNFYQRVGLRTRAHGPHMAVERAAGNGHVLRQTEAFRPLFAERADRNISGEGVGKQRVCQVFVDDRVEFIEERCRRQTAPAFMPQRFMTGAATAPTNILRTRGAGEQGGNPVAQLNP